MGVGARVLYYGLYGECREGETGRGCLWIRGSWLGKFGLAHGLSCCWGSGPVGIGWDGMGDWRRGVEVVATGSIRFETGRQLIRSVILENLGGYKLDMMQFYRGHSLSRGEGKIEKEEKKKSKQKS